jgi:thiamine kinase-like enzyme
MSDYFEIIKSYVKLIINDVNFDDLKIISTRLNGLSNDVYLVTVKTPEKELNQFIFRLFGINHKHVDTPLESHIIRCLSDNALTPKVLFTDKNMYSIEEYIHDASHPTADTLLLPDMLERMFSALLQYSKIDSIFNFLVYRDKIVGDEEILLIKEGYSGFDIKSNIFDVFRKKSYPNAVKNMKVLLNGTYINKETLRKLNKINSYLENFEKLFEIVFPKGSLFVLNHNDVHRLNLLQRKTGDIIVLDHEYACLNLIGYDITNYLVESCWDYTTQEFPYYTFDRNKLNFDLFYKIYSEYLDYFEENFGNLSSYVLNKVRCIHTVEYLHRNICLINLFWFLYSVNYINVENAEDQANFDYLTAALDRMEIFEQSFTQLEEYLKINE